MNEKHIATPQDLATRLIALFPDFESEWDDGDGYDCLGCYNYHIVFSELAPNLRTYLEESAPQTVLAFCALINHFVSDGGEKENAVSTCLLEHASQVGIRKIVRPHLSDEARMELR